MFLGILDDDGPPIGAPSFLGAETIDLEASRWEPIVGSLGKPWSRKAGN